MIINQGNPHTVTHMCEWELRVRQLKVLQSTLILIFTWFTHGMGMITEYLKGKRKKATGYDVVVINWYTSINVTVYH